MELSIIRSPVKVRSIKKGESKGQKAFDDTVVQLSDIHIPIYSFKSFSFAKYYVNFLLC
jgi:hypothetical protein